MADFNELYDLIDIYKEKGLSDSSGKTKISLSQIKVTMSKCKKDFYNALKQKDISTAEACIDETEQVINYITAIMSKMTPQDFAQSGGAIVGALTGVGAFVGGGLQLLFSKRPSKKQNKQTTTESVEYDDYEYEYFYENNNQDFYDTYFGDYNESDYIVESVYSEDELAYLSEDELAFLEAGKSLGSFIKTAKNAGKAIKKTAKKAGENIASGATKAIYKLGDAANNNDKLQSFDNAMGKIGDSIYNTKAGKKAVDGIVDAVGNGKPKQKKSTNKTKNNTSGNKSKTTQTSKKSKQNKTEQNDIDSDIDLMNPIHELSVIQDNSPRDSGTSNLSNAVANNNPRTSQTNQRPQENETTTKTNTDQKKEVKQQQSTPSTKEKETIIDKIADRVTDSGLADKIVNSSIAQSIYNAQDKAIDSVSNTVNKVQNTVNNAKQTVQQGVDDVKKITERKQSKEKAMDQAWSNKASTSDGKTVAKGAANIVGKAASNTVDNGKNALVAAGTKAKDTATSAVNSAVNTVTNKAQETFNNAKDSVKQGFQNMGSKVTGGSKSKQEKSKKEEAVKNDINNAKKSLFDFKKISKSLAGVGVGAAVGAASGAIITKANVAGKKAYRDIQKALISAKKALSQMRVELNNLKREMNINESVDYDFYSYKTYNNYNFNNELEYLNESTMDYILNAIEESAEEDSISFNEAQILIEMVDTINEMNELGIDESDFEDGMFTEKENILRSMKHYKTSSRRFDMHVNQIVILKRACLDAIKSNNYIEAESALSSLKNELRQCELHIRELEYEPSVIKHVNKLKKAATAITAISSGLLALGVQIPINKAIDEDIEDFAASVREEYSKQNPGRRLIYSKDEGKWDQIKKDYYAQDAKHGNKQIIANTVAKVGSAGLILGTGAITNKLISKSIMKHQYKKVNKIFEKLYAEVQQIELSVKQMGIEYNKKVTSK